MSTAAQPRRPWTPSQIVLTLLGTAVSVVFLAPFAWGLFTSLKSETEAVEKPCASAMGENRVLQGNIEGTKQDEDHSSTRCGGVVAAGDEVYRLGRF